MIQMAKPTERVHNLALFIVQRRIAAIRFSMWRSRFIEERHDIRADGWSAGPAWYELSHCARCGLSIDDERINWECQEY